MIISELQRKIATWTAPNKDHCVDRLLRIICHPLWFRQAAEITLKSKGANTPGIDGIRNYEDPDMTIEYIDSSQEQIEKAYNSLMSGVKMPEALRQK